MKIIRLKAENVKRLSAVEITPEGNLVVVGGNNAQGKSSVLDSIAMALGGKREHCQEPIRQGARRAEVICELDDLTVTRTWTAGATRLVVAAPDGSHYSTPQAVLDKLVGHLSFDPLGFTRLEPARQLAVLKEVVGLDFTDVDKKRSNLYDRRRELNGQVKAAEIRANDAPAYPRAPAQELSLADLTTALAEVQKRAVHRTELGLRAQAQSKELEGWHDQINQTRDQIRHLEELVKRQEAALDEVGADHKAALDAIKEAGEVADDGPLREQIASIEETNEQVRSNRRRQELADSLSSLQAASDSLTDQIEQLDQRKTQDLENATFPIADLSFDESDVLFQGLPLDQASSAEQLQVSVAMGFALNPELRVLLIRDGSLLDGPHLELLARLAGEQDGQVWLERVGEGEEVSVVIEDGAVKEADAGAKDGSAPSQP